MFLDKFIHRSLWRHSETFFKARVLVGILFAYNGILVLTNIYLLFFAPLEWQSAWLSAVLVLLLQMAWVAVLVCLRQWGRYEQCCQLTVGSTVLGIAVGVIVSGGPIESPATPVNVVPIILAFVLSGRKSGLIWTQIVLSVHALMVLLALMKLVTFPQMMDLSYIEVHHGAHWLITYMAIMGLMYVFDSLNTRLKKELDMEKARFEYLAAHDPLTNLANRHMFDDNLTQAMSRCDRHNTQTALLFVDLDSLKSINDTLGHGMGDKALQVISARMKTSMRQSDTVARIGGDEFAVIVEDVNSKEDLVSLADKILLLISQPIKGIPNDLRITGSVGIAIYPEHTQDKNHLVSYADQAMYNAKKIKNSYCVYSRKKSAKVAS